MPVFFASDFHLGVDAKHTSRERELRIVAWLDDCLAAGSEAIYLVGDLFEFWFEWKRVAPRGYVRLFGKLAEITDVGIPVHVFTGNHDLWMDDYLPRELGVTLHRRPIVVEHYGYRILVGHGDGLGPGDTGYKLMKKVFTASWAKWLYARLHPNLAMGLAYFFSGKSRSLQPAETEFLGPDNEWLVAYAERKAIADPSLDYFVFGHRHLPIDHTLTDGKRRYVNLGDWLHYYTYARLDAGGVTLLEMED